MDKPKRVKFIRCNCNGVKVYSAYSKKILMAKVRER